MVNVQSVAFYKGLCSSAAVNCKKVDEDDGYCILLNTSFLSFCIVDF